MKVGLAFGSSIAVDGNEAIELCRVAEECGFESVWGGEHVIIPDTIVSKYPYTEDGKIPAEPDTPIPDPLIWLAYVAAAAPKLGRKAARHCGGSQRAAAPPPQRPRIRWSGASSAATSRLAAAVTARASPPTTHRRGLTVDASGADHCQEGSAQVCEEEDEDPPPHCVTGHVAPAPAAPAPAVEETAPPSAKALLKSNALSFGKTFFAKFLISS